MTKRIDGRFFLLGALSGALIALLLHPKSVGVESALTGGDGKVLTDPPTSTTSWADPPVGPDEPTAVARRFGAAAVGLDPTL